jgi:hypothetical protein
LTVTLSIPGVLLPLLEATVRQAQLKLWLSVIQFHSSRCQESRKDAFI